MHSRKKKSRSTHQNTDTSFPNEKTLTSHPSTPSTARNLHKKEEPPIARIQKGHPKHSNINKMNTQRNTQQIKEQDKYPPNQNKEKDIGNLHDKEFQIMIVKMIQNLENKLDLQISTLEPRIEKMQDRINKDQEEIKKESIYNEYIMNNAINYIYFYFLLKASLLYISTTK